jgi:hypothetical protein
MHPLSDSQIDAMVARYYAEITVPPLSEARSSARRPFLQTAWVRAAAASMIVFVCCAGAMALPDVRGAVVQSVLRALGERNVRVSQLGNVPQSSAAALMASGLELPLGLPDSARLVSLRKLGGRGSTFLATYRVDGRRGDATFSLISRTRPPDGSNLVLDDAQPIRPIRYASWSTKKETVLLVSRGDALSAAEIAAVKQASSGR